MLVYDAIDSAGSHASCDARFVSVVDTTAPVFDAIDLTVLLPGVKLVFNNGIVARERPNVRARRPDACRVLGHTITLSGETIIIDGEIFTLDGRTVMLLMPLDQYQSFTIADFIAALGADCDPNLDLGDVVIERVTSDELDNASGIPTATRRTTSISAPIAARSGSASNATTEGTAASTP